MKIRKAKPTEATLIAPLLLSAMEDIIFSFIGEKSTKKATLFLADLISRADNQYAYHNCWVAEIDKAIVGAVCVYDGAKLHVLRLPIIAALKETFQREWSFTDETQAGEIYIDSIGVHPDWREKGIGAQLLHFLIAQYVQKQRLTLGLLVENENTNAKRLYLKLGFKEQGTTLFMKKHLTHLQLKYSN